MADIDLLFFLRPAQRNEIGTVVVDATVREHHEYTSQVTEHPIETGAMIADHVLNEPIRLTIEGEVTDTPVQILGGLLSGEGGERRLEAFDTLRALRTNRQPIDVVTGLAVYRNMIITSMIFPRTSRTGQRLQFVIELREIEFAQAQIIRQRALATENVRPAERDIAQETKPVGKSSTRKASPTEEQRTGSFLFQWFGDLF